jgi:hypothetical protein
MLEHLEEINVNVMLLTVNAVLLIVNTVVARHGGEHHRTKLEKL